MKLSHSSSLLLAIIFLISGVVTAEPAYKGDKEAFMNFAAKYLKTDWPEPETIGYFDPLGKGNAKVIRYAHWTPRGPKIKGVVVHFNGRTEFIERNIYAYKDLLERGYEVWTMDWRGQGLSQRQGNPKETGQKHTIDSFDTYLEDADYFIKNVVKFNDSKNKILLAHSMGGQIALRYLLSTEGSGVFDRAVLSSPLLRLPETIPWLGFIERPLVKYANKIKVSNFGLDLGWEYGCTARRKADWESDFKENECDLVGNSSIDKSSLVNSDNANQYSHDYTKLADINCLVSSSVDKRSDQFEPDLRVACPTSLWTREAIKSTELVYKTASRLKTPTLIIRDLPDAAVSNSGQDKFCTSAPEKFIRCDSISEIDGHQSGHELLIEVEPIRNEFFSKFYTFIEKT